MWDRDFPDPCENADVVSCREKLRAILCEDDPEVSTIRKAAQDVAQYANLDWQISRPLRSAILELLNALSVAGLVGEED